MDKVESIELDETQLLTDIYNTYVDCKDLFIRCEELLPDMKIFVAPLLEHRDAFDHIMTAFSYKKERKEVDIGNLKSAFGHETRAYFDTADYACIKVREYISLSLKKFSNRKINKVWPEYKAIRKKIIDWSEDIYTVRNSRTATRGSIEKYKEKVIPELFNILKDFIINIEPNLRKI